MYLLIHEKCMTSMLIYDIKKCGFQILVDETNVPFADLFQPLAKFFRLSQEQGEAMEAEKIYCHALNKSEELLGAWHPWTANCAHHLGCLLQRKSWVVDGCHFKGLAN